MSKGNYVSGGRLPYGGLFDEWEVEIASNAIATFRAKYPWLRFPETEDLMQECLTKWYYVRGRFRQRGWASTGTYMSRVVRLHLQTILRKELTYKRRINHLAFSLDEPHHESGETLADIVADKKDVPDPALLADIRNAMEELTHQQHRICCLLGQGYTVERIADLLGKPRSTVRDNIKKIRETFTKKGLSGHL